ncbi:MAG: hypothetical protein WA667_22140 [Candidatus Nitrosopolaris sp.]
MYDKGFGNRTNNLEIQSVGNQTGSDDGSEQNVTSAPSIACNVSTLFCGAYVHAYTRAYHMNVPYWHAMQPVKNMPIM